ncbi:IS3 family transposase [Corynebacterium sp. HMSC068G04]|uniref:IS3 family transposase n=1 Tax=Corynebacterium sp. HMSC068G04 TaxID=1739497 RepID=UPI00352A279C
MGSPPKTEFYDHQRWATLDVARKAVVYWVEVIYNCRRWHSVLGIVSPVNIENYTGSTTYRREIAV